MTASNPMAMTALLIAKVARFAAARVDSGSLKGESKPVVNYTEGTVESIAAVDAKIRLSELLDRAAKGETFQITKHGRPVGKLVPPDTSRDPQAIAEAVRRLKRFRGAFKGLSRDELIDLKHKGHRY